MPVASDHLKPLYLRETHPLRDRLREGARMTQPEFHEIYQHIDESFHAELIEGVVHLREDGTSDEHAEPHADLAGWLGAYRAETPNISVGATGTLILDNLNEPEPDLAMRVRHGGRTHLQGRYLAGSPELAIEVALSSERYDLGLKKRAYARNAVQEYLVFHVASKTLDWWELINDEYVALPRTEDGCIASHVFPGLILDVPAIMRGDMKTVLDRQRAMLGHGSHADFCKHLEQLRSHS